MFEISRVNAHRGIFEWVLEGSMPKAISWVGRLGPLKTRVLSLSLIMASLFFTINTTFASWLFNKVGLTSYSAVLVQEVIKWTLAFLGGVVWFCAFLFRRPQAVLLMDRPQGILNLQETTLWSIAPKKERTYKFEEVENIEVFAKDRQPPTPQGYVRLRFKGNSSDPQSHELSFRFLTQEQFQYFPSNLYKILGKEPKGDWNEDEIPASEDLSKL